MNSLFEALSGMGIGAYDALINDGAIFPCLIIVIAILYEIVKKVKSKA